MKILFPNFNQICIWLEQLLSSIDFKISYLKQSEIS